MKLYYYDSKHEQIHGEIELGKLNDDHLGLIGGIEQFLFEQGIIDRRYKNLVVAESYEQIYTEGEPNPEVTFKGRIV